MKKEDIYTLQLVDGLKSTIGSTKVVYKTVILRETGVADELMAVELAERLVYIAGKPTLLLSDEMYRVALTMRHIDKFVCAGCDDIGQDVIDLNMIGRLSPFDLQKIEERCLLIGLAAQVRYGLLNEAEFDSMLQGEVTPEQAIVPRSTGQTEELGGVGAEHQSGPSMLADLSTQRP